MLIYLIRYYRVLAVGSAALSLVNTVLLIGRHKSLSNLFTAASLVLVLAAGCGFLLQRRKVGRRRAS